LAIIDGPSLPPPPPPAEVIDENIEFPPLEPVDVIMFDPTPPPPTVTV
jgi:hypothetical protein